MPLFRKGSEAPTPASSTQCVFIVTYGRSGSTLLNGLLNAIPGYLVRGENADALRHLFKFHTTMTTSAAEHPSPKTRQPTAPWFGIADFPADLSIELCRRIALDTVMRPEPTTRVTGFKEIRWSGDDLDDYVDWLRVLFPLAKFVVNTRDHADVLQSKWWARKDNTQTLAEFEAQILALAERLGDAAYRVHYDDYVADPASLRGLFEWLGEEWDEAAVRATMSTPHSY